MTKGLQALVSTMHLDYIKVFSSRGRHGFDMHGRRVKAHVRGGAVTRLLKADQRLFGNEFALAA